MINIHGILGNTNGISILYSFNVSLLKPGTFYGFILLNVYLGKAGTFPIIRELYKLSVNM